jgi:serine/threonine-protein kinase
VLLSTRQTHLTPAEFVSAAGDIFSIFDERTQDSGNISYGVATADARYFVKTAGLESSSPALSHAERVALLRNAIRLGQSAAHATLPALRNVVESAQGPLLVYDWVDGELLNAPAERRSDPASAYLRFRRLPAPDILKVLDTIIDLHCHLASRGWIAVDFYDGSLLYDFVSRLVHVVDLDCYHFGPFVNHMGRLFGSTRFMAPEEFERGVGIDERTNVFTLGRTICELLSERPGRDFLHGTPELLALTGRAGAREPADRYATVQTLSDAWRSFRMIEPPSGSHV